MRRSRFAVASLVALSFFAILVGISFFTTRPALAGLQVESVEMASCSGGGISLDLVATGTVEDVVAAPTSSRVEVRVEKVLLGDRSYAGKTIFVGTDSGTNGGNTSDVSFQDGARYELYLQGEGDEWKTNICLGTHQLTEPNGDPKTVPEAASSPGSPTMPETGGPSLTTLAAVGGSFWRVLGRLTGEGVVVGETNFLLFLAASLPLILTPGPDMIYVATRGISRGRKVALVSASGVGLGYVVHTALAVAGLSALLQSSATAFLAVKYAGAAYLLYLGARTLLDRSGFASLHGEGATTEDLVRIFFQGTVTSVLNPKGILFFLAFLPQFVSLSGGSVALQVSVLGSIFALLCLVVYGLVGLFSGGLGDALVRKPRLAGALRWVTGGILVALGLRLAVPEPR